VARESGSDVGCEDQDDRDLSVLRRFRDLGRWLRHICEPLWAQWYPSGWLGELQSRQLAAIGGTTLWRPNLEDPLFVVWSISNTLDDVFDRMFGRELLDSPCRLVRSCKQKIFRCPRLPRS
jgi:hypothetical protein